MDSTSMLLQTLKSQEEVQKFIAARGGNKNNVKDYWEGFNTQKPAVPKYEPTEQFYKGDKILTGDYFKGWNDSYFFQSSVFRNNVDFWNNPFKTKLN
jgi:hypothetical protein